MRRRSLGSTGIQVSEVGLGTWTFSGDWGAQADEDSLAAIERAIDLGITYVDVAAAWGRGRVERLVGEALRGRRDRVVLGARVGVDILDGGMRQAFAPDRLEDQLASSLERLGTDHVDVVLLHAPPARTLRHEEVAKALDGWRAAGKIRAWGATVTTEKAAIAAMDVGAQVLALPYNVFHGDVLRPITAEVDRKRIGVLAHTTLEYGLLAGRWSPTTRFPPDDHRSRRFRPMDLRARLAKVEKLRFLGEGSARTMAEGALRFVLATGLVSSAVLGVRSAGQMEELARASGDDGPHLDAQALSRVGRALQQ